MASNKKTGLLKLIDEEAEDSLYKKPRPKCKNSLKHVVRNDEDEFDQHEGLILKNKLVEIDEEQSRAYRQKATTTLIVPSEANKQIENKILENLENIQVSLEMDYNAMKDNEQVLDQLVICGKQNIQQICSLLKQKIQDVNGIRKSFIEEVEGLLTRGAMKPDDRPLWFDVYKAFPPTVDPKFAQPKPEIKPIRQILYQEDITRAKFHSNGHGLRTTNMLNPNSETQIKRLLQQYDKLKSEGVAEEELIEKSVAAVEIDRQLEAPKQKIMAKEPESVTAQVLAEANLKNIFKE